jgi:hypothetical protein
MVSKARQVKMNNFMVNDLGYGVTNSGGLINPMLIRPQPIPLEVSFVAV